MRYTEKIVVITDSSSDLGKVIKRRFEQEGATVVGISSTLFTKDTIDLRIGEIEKQYGTIDVLIHNNNEVAKKSIESCTDDEYLRSLNINAKSAFFFTQAVGQVMRKSKKGKILYISSIHGEKPNGADFSYSVSKGAVKMLMREACLDLGIYNVKVNVLEVGAVEGDDSLFISENTPLYEHMQEMIPNKKVHSFEQIADISLFLCSDESDMLNGADITADGGFLKSYSPRYSYEEYESIDKSSLRRANSSSEERNYPTGTVNAGKVAVITGSATSIGQGVAVALAREGVKVVVTYNAAPADETMKKIKEVNGDAIAVKTDVSNRESIRNLFKTAYEEYGEIDLLVNNAAIQYNKWMFEYSEEEYDMMMRVNCMGYFMCMQEALPYIKKGSFSRIVNVASIHAERPTNFDIVYSMTKGGVRMLTREAAVEFAKYDITVNQLYLGAIKVPSRSGNFESKIPKPLEFKNKPKGGFLSGRVGYPYDVGYIVSFLLDERSQFINGAAICADGGAMNV